MTPEQFVQARVDFAQMFDHSPRLRLLMQKINQHILGGDGLEVGYTAKLTLGKGNPEEKVAEEIAKSIRGGMGILVPRDMTPLVMAAAAALVTSDVYDLTEFPDNDGGIIRFEGGLPFIYDDKGTEESITWAAWSAPVTVVENTAFGQVQSTSRMIGCFTDMITHPFTPNNSGDPEMYRELQKISGGRWLPVSTMAIRHKQKISSGKLLVDNMPATNMSRMVYAAVLLMGQPVVASSHLEGSKRVTKSARRANVPSNVRVLSLNRRSGSSAGTGGGREFHHQWVVRGHWRQQRVGPGRAEFRRTWVTPHVKGPVDAPILISPKVYRP